VRSQGALYVDVELEVRFHDVDMVGVVWHGHYLRYFENARWALMDRLDYGFERMVDSGYAWPIVDLQTRYLCPVRFGDRLRVRCSLVEWESRLVLNYLVSRLPDEIRVARARTVQVAVDGRTGELQFATPPDFAGRVREVLARGAA
jgi:acyl-CoA thioester hydrolase